MAQNAGGQAHAILFPITSLNMTIAEATGCIAHRLIIVTLSEERRKNGLQGLAGQIPIHENHLDTDDRRHHLVPKIFDMSTELEPP